MKIFKRFLFDKKGFMLISMMFLLIVFWYCWSLTMDGTDAKYAANTAKRALNRAVKAATLQVDKEQLATGVLLIDEEDSRLVFDEIIRRNLFLNPDNTPSSNSPLATAPQVLEYFVYQGPGFPYTHTYTIGGSFAPIQYTFQDPGVMAVIKIQYRFNFIGNNTEDIYVYSVAEIKR